MLSPNAISSVLEQFGDGSIQVQPPLCLNARHKDAGCRRCVDACPTGAIALHQGRPHLDPDRCVNCGLCLHNCPTDVFTQRGAPEDPLAQTVSILPHDTLALACPQHKDPGLTSAPVTTVVRHKRCLAALSTAQLLELSDGGRRTLWLDDSPCDQCPIGPAWSTIAATTTATNRLLQAFGRPPAIHTLKKAGFLEKPGFSPTEPIPRPVFEGDQPAVSRRGFFSALTQLTRRTAASVLAETLAAPDPSGPVPVEQRLPQRIPASRGHLYQQLKRLGTPADEPIDTAGLPFAQVVIDGNACSACRLCVRFCPTGALRFVAEDEHFELGFRSALCIDCGICQVACPEDAVRFGSQLTAEALLEREPQQLVAGHLAPCAGCGEPTAIREAGPSAEEPRCSFCRQGPDPTAPLRDTTGLLADLLKRLPEGTTDNRKETSHE